MAYFNWGISPVDHYPIATRSTLGDNRTTLGGWKVRQSRPYRVTVTRYYRQGRRCARTDPGAIPRTEQTDTWYYRPPGSRRPVSLKTTDEAIAWTRFNEAMRRHREAERGISDPTLEHSSRTTLEHVTDWLESVRAGNATEKHLELISSRIKAMISMAKWHRLADISADSCTRALSRLERDQELSAQTRNHYLTACKQFSRWLWEHERLRTHPLARLRPVSVETDRRHDRAVPTAEEIAALFSYLSGWAAFTRSGLSPSARILLYSLAMATGLRADELRSLNRESFDLDAATVTVAASYSKRRRRDTQKLPPWLVDDLRVWFASGGGTWAELVAIPGRMLARDWAACGVDYERPGPDGPLFKDFQSLRHYFCTMVANQPGMDPKTLVSLTRHSSVQLALDTYAKPMDNLLRDAVDRIPPP